MTKTHPSKRLKLTPNLREFSPTRQPAADTAPAQEATRFCDGFDDIPPKIYSNNLPANFYVADKETLLLNGYVVGQAELQPPPLDGFNAVVARSIHGYDLIKHEKDIGYTNAIFVAIWRVVIMGEATG